MLYVGLDYHLRRSTFCVLDRNGKKIKSREVLGTLDKVVEELGKVKAEGGGEAMMVCYEASCGYGVVYDRLKGLAREIKVAHPNHLRLIFKSKRKNDRIDARKLATLLFLDQVPEVWVPGIAVRGWRQMIEFRNRLARKRARVKNEIRGQLRNAGIAAPRGLWGKRGREWLEGLSGPDPLFGSRLCLLLDELDSCRARIKLAEKDLNRYSKSHPGVALLMTIPGIGIRTAECLAAYIDDPGRFSSKRAPSYFGLVPKLDASAGKIRQGHITKEGPPTARRLLVEAAWTSVRKSDKVRAYFERVKKNDDDRNKIAIVATAHYLLRVCLAMLKTGEVWNES